jgi:glycosyltransferase involved in cell wall biosynthesis
MVPVLTVGGGKRNLPDRPAGSGDDRVRPRDALPRGPQEDGMKGPPLRVLMLGPSLDAPGGVAVVARRLMEAPPEGVVLEHLCTTVDGGAMQKAATAARALLDAGQRPRPDVVHVHLGGGASLPRKALLATALRARGVPIVTHCHFAGVADLERPGPRRALLRGLLGLSQRVVVLSAAQERLLRPLAGARVVRVPNGVPTERFVPLGPTPGPPTVLYLGGAEERKGWRELRAALDSLSDVPWRARLGGGDDGVLRDAFAGWDRVELLGRLDEAAALAAMQDADVFVLPSRAEGLPLALLEAMSCGLACVATSVDGAADALDDGVTGLLVPPRDAPALADALRRALTDPDLRGSLGRAARRAAVDRFDHSAMAAALARLWRDAVGQPASAP